MPIGGEAEKSGPGQTENKARNWRGLDGRVRDLADGTMLNVGLGKLVGMKMQRLQKQHPSEQAEANPEHPAPGWGQVGGINVPDSHGGAVREVRRASGKKGYMHPAD